MSSLLLCQQMLPTQSDLIFPALCIKFTFHIRRSSANVARIRDRAPQSGITPRYDKTEKKTKKKEEETRERAENCGNRCETRHRRSHDAFSRGSWRNTNQCRMIWKFRTIRPPLSPHLSVDTPIRLPRRLYSRDWRAEIISSLQRQRAIVGTVGRSVLAWFRLMYGRNFGVSGIRV
jgi:hypothetical protein